MEEEKKNTKTAEFKVLKNGPLQVSGKFILKSANGELVETREMIFLCRCGNSANKPYCDGSHRRANLGE